MNWTLRFENGEPWTLNQERGRGVKKGAKKGAKTSTGHWSEWSEPKRTWRDAFKILALEAKIPPLAAIRVLVRQECRTNVMPDTGNIFPPVKAAIDGLVDAKVIPKDTREFVKFIGFYAPVCTGRDIVILEIEEDLQGWECPV